MPERKKVLIIVDRPNWAFDVIAHRLIAHNDRAFDISIYYVKGAKVPLDVLQGRYDLLFFMHWSLAATIKNGWFGLRRNQCFASKRLTPRFANVDLSRVICGIHAHHDYDDRRSMPDNKILPPPNLVSFLNQFKGITAVSRRLAAFFSEAGVSHVACTENGVDQMQFRPLRTPGIDDRLVVGTSGTKKRDWKEGISDYVEPLAELDFVDVRIATPEDGRYVPHEKMHEFLNELDVYISASSSEGFPLKVLEACACGRPVIATKVGGTEDLIIDQESGYFVERRLDAIIEKLKLLHADRGRLRQMGARNREEVETHWSWARRAGPWLDFIEAHLQPPDSNDA